MLFQRINRTDAEKVFVVLYNVAGATVSAGGAVGLDIGASADGVRATVVTTALLNAFAGIAAEAIVDSAYGKVQVYGYNSAAYVTNLTDVVITSGSSLGLKDAVTYLTYTTGSTAAWVNGAGLSRVNIVEAFATATAGAVAAATKKVFVRNL